MTPIEQLAPLMSASFCRNLIPYVFVKRSCFLYHYIPGLLYGELMLAMMVDKLAGASPCGRAWFLVFI